MPVQIKIFRKTFSEDPTQPLDNDCDMVKAMQANAALTLGRGR